MRVNTKHYAMNHLRQRRYAMYHGVSAEGVAAVRFHKPTDIHTTHHITTQRMEKTRRTSRLLEKDGHETVMVAEDHPTGKDTLICCRRETSREGSI